MINYNIQSVTGMKKGEYRCDELTGRDGFKLSPVGVDSTHLHLHQRRADTLTLTNKMAGCNDLEGGGRPRGEEGGKADDDS